jgi:hypothetical protein
MWVSVPALTEINPETATAPIDPSQAGAWPMRPQDSLQ